MAVPKEERVVEIRVNGQRANASLKELDAAVAVLNAQFRKMAADDPARAGLLKQLQAMKQRVADVRQEVAGVTETTGLMKQAFANAFALITGGGITQALGKVLDFFVSSREEALASAKSSADLDNTLRSTAHSAGLTAAEIRKIGEERAKVTLFDDDETNQASALLLTFTNIKKGVFEQAMPAIQDLATKMGGDGPADLKGAAIQVGKALNDPIKGITALTRVGVSFTEQQKEQITQLVKSGHAADAQRMILAELNKEFGGTAEAARKAAGGVATLSMWFNEFKETVGGKVNQVLGALSQWLGRVIEKADPLVELVSAIVEEFASLYREVGDVLVGMGLFSEKTDTAAFFVEALKVAITLMLTPIRTLVRISRELTDAFIDWYNKSELLRGILGGLGAVVKSLFISIKDDAIKVLGGVGDLLVGIFTLDKEKVLSGMKAMWQVTKDLAYENGKKAAQAAVDGYQANKNNLIVRTKVQVSTEEEKTEKLGGPVKNDGGGESAADKKAREAEAKAAAVAALKIHLAEIEAEKLHQQMLTQLRHAAVVARDGEDDLAVQLSKIYTEGQLKRVALEAQAKKDIAQLTGTAQEKADRQRDIEQKLAADLLILQAETGQKQAEAADKAAADTYKEKQEETDRLVELEEEQAARQQEALEAPFHASLQLQHQLDEQRYQIRRAAFERELTLIASRLGKESAEYKKAFAAQEKDQKEHDKRKKANEEQAFKAKQTLLKLEMSTASDVLGFTLQLLDQDASARKEHHGLYVALAAAKIIVDGVKEVQQIWEYSAENPYNGETAGVAGAVMGAIQTALAVGRTGIALGQVFATRGGGGGGGGSYWAGGATGTGAGLAVSPMGQLLALSGLRLGAGGRLQDGSGFAVAGIVHEDEYVVPKWLRADPQVAAVEQWLEARRLRGFADGGRTSASSGATLPVAAASPSSDGEKLYAVLTQVLDANRAMVQQLGDVKQWQANLQVQLNLRDASAKTDQYKQVQYNSAIRSKSSPGS